MLVEAGCVVKGFVSVSGGGEYFSLVSVKKRYLSMLGFETVGAWYQSLPGVAQLAVVAVGVFVVGYVVGRPILEAIEWRRGTSSAMRKAVESSYVVLLAMASLAIGFAASNLQSAPSATGAVLAAATLSAGIGARDILRNTVSGLFIANMNDVSVGSWVEWGEYEGTVQAISLRQTTVRTFDGESVLVPNSELTNNAVVSPQANGVYRVDYEFGIDYGDDLQRAKQCLLEEARSISGVARDPEPTVRVDDLAASTVKVQVNVWVHQPTPGKVTRVRSALLERGKERLQEEGISFPSPKREVEVVSDGQSSGPSSHHGVR